jgi:hypothetical protein
MDDTIFWQMIEQAKIDSDGDNDRQVHLLSERLAELSADEIVQYGTIFRQYRAQAYRWDLWAAADILNGGCSDDAFMDFRAWLIAQGREVFHKALANPDWLAEYVPVIQTEWGDDSDTMMETMNYVPFYAYEEKTGSKELPESAMIQHPSDPAGETWTDDDLPQRFPALWAKFGDSDEDEA